MVTRPWHGISCPLQFSSVERLAKLENEARNRVEKDLKRINPKASPKAQFVFDTIAKMSVPPRHSNSLMRGRGDLLARDCYGVS